MPMLVSAVVTLVFEFTYNSGGTEAGPTELARDSLNTTEDHLEAIERW